MAASLYRLANKLHPLDAPATATQAVDQIVTTHENEAPAAASVAEQVEVDSSSVTVEPAATDSSDDNVTPVSQAVTWDPNWTKAQLLEVALQLNLNVTVANTKAQIIEALKLATAS